MAESSTQEVNSFNKSLSAIPTGPPGIPETKDRSLDGTMLEDMWVETWIKSREFRPWENGFMLDGKSGEAYFSRILVGCSSEWAAVDIRKTSGVGTGVFIRSKAGASLDIEQQSDANAIKVVADSVSGSSGGAVNILQKAGDGATLTLEQRGVGVAAYFEHEQAESTHFYPIMILAGRAGGTLQAKVYVGDGTSPNGTLWSAAGSLCLSSDGNLFVGQGGTVWKTATLT